MYYHDITFAAQFKFFAYSFLAGLADGLLALILCAKPIRGKLRFICDVLFCLLSVLILVCTNLVFQEGALRIYQVIAFLAALLFVLVLIKKHSDVLALKVAHIVEENIAKPLSRLFKYIVNKIKKLLKKMRLLVYNFINQTKERKKRNAEKTRIKKEKKKKTGKTAS